jgi:hypothetical protein
MIERSLETCYDMRSEIEKELIQSGSRIMPLGVFVWGGPNCGKSTFFPAATRIVGDVLGKSCDEKFGAERNAADKFMSTWNPGKWYFSLDDINWRNPD